MYHFNIPGRFIWTFHIILGIILTYLGYITLNDRPLTQSMSLFLILSGILAIIYHLHIWVFGIHTH